MKNKVYAALLTLLILPLGWAESVIEIPNNAVNQRILKELDLDHDCMGNNRDSLHFLLDEDAQEKLSKRKFFKTQLFKHSTTAVENVLSQFDQFPLDQDLGIYHTFEEMEAELQVTAESHPSLVTLTVGAISHEGRPIYVLDITGSGCGTDKVNFLITGTHHAREWISTEVPLAFIEHLVAGYGNDELITNLLDTSHIVIVPMLNPDGGVYSRTQERMWRKNRRKPEGQYSTGIDNNRNYPYQWGGSGSSSWGGSQTYRGPEPTSEIETQLVISLQEQYGFKTAVSFHSYSELVLWPWGYTSSIQAADHDIFALYGNEMGEIMDYQPMQASNLYPAAGIFDDTLYATYGVLAYTIELGTQFVPHEQQVPIIEQKSINALRYLFTTARDPFGGNQNTPVRKTMRFLEQLVYHIENHKQSQETAPVYDKLMNFDEDLRLQAMDKLKMHPAMREKINDGISYHLRYKKLHQ
ncbi:zinc carboxypeptidase [bacterium]|jgi:carboxypeptidase T|nr:zinc carboxypeptidase [bacterium]